MPYRSKTLATWLALCLGAIGAHRWYLRGWRDALAWLFLLPSALGAVGVLRMRGLGPDDHLAWVLIPLLGLSVSAAMLQAIVIALTPDDRWDARHNPQHPVHATAWGPVLAAGLALLLGGGVLMATLAFGGQRWFEWLAEEPVPAATAPGG